MKSANKALGMKGGIPRMATIPMVPEAEAGGHALPAGRRDRGSHQTYLDNRDRKEAGQKPVEKRSGTKHGENE